MFDIEAQQEQHSLQNGVGCVDEWRRKENFLFSSTSPAYPLTCAMKSVAQNLLQTHPDRSPPATMGFVGLVGPACSNGVALGKNVK